MPLTYPGMAPADSGLVEGDAFHPVAPGELDARLTALRQPGLDHRQPVVAIGSNASPARLRGKFGRAGHDSVVLPMTRIRVHGLARGVSAHVSRFGYVPATPIAASGETARLFVIWPDPAQLSVIDATEPTYDRVRLDLEFDADDHEDVHAGRDLHLYASKRGCLVDAYGNPRRLTGQRELIQSLLDESDAVRALAGPTHTHWLTAMRDRAARDRVRTLWAEERRVRERSRPL